MYNFSKKTINKLNELFKSYNLHTIEDTYYREAKYVKWTSNFLEYKRYNGALNTLEEYLKLYQIVCNTAYYRYTI